MALTFLDGAIILAFFAMVIWIGLRMRGRAEGGLVNYFVSGRTLPWWLAGTSMVATTFAADTPLAVTGLVAKHGLAGNWVWWSFATGGMFTVFVYARLWRRAEVLTDVELVEQRYSGASAAVLRGGRALYVALLINPLIIGWVTSAMVTVLRETALYQSSAAGEIGWIIGFCLAAVGLYATLSGMWGVTLTDFVQFFFAMAGCMVLAAIAVWKLGGIDAMRSKVVANYAGGEQAFRLLPNFSDADPWMPMHVFLILLLVQWWAAWYPGAEPGGGGYIVQRMAACRDERHATLATLWFQIAHYCVRPWPWLVVALAALAMYPDLPELPDPGAGYAMVIRDVSPQGVRGLILATFFAAFMSTISTQMNWGASYLVRDVYQRFIAPEANDKHLTRASRIASLLVLAAGGGVAAWMQQTSFSVDNAWQLLLAVGAGTGSVFMLRWFWWRINAWSEIVAMAGSLVFYLLLRSRIPTSEVLMACVAGLTVIAWLVATFLTRPTDTQTLEAFYRKVHPWRAGWRPIADRLPDVTPDNDLPQRFAAALAAAAMAYAVLAGLGGVIFSNWTQVVVCFAVATVSAATVRLLAPSAFNLSEQTMTPEPANQTQP